MIWIGQNQTYRKNQPSSTLFRITWCSYAYPPPYLKGKTKQAVIKSLIYCKIQYDVSV
jgi:hypothetical protein